MNPKPIPHQNEPHQLARRTIGLVLAGGRGSRLHALTDRRAKPAVYFGGKFRIVDFALSNCLNSGVRRVSVVTQYKSHSLLRHLQRGWSFLRSEFNEFIDLLPAQQRIDETSWYQGTADAVFQNLDILSAERPDYILVLAGDHIYKMDYANLIADHVAKGAPCTVACIEVPLAEARSFGVMAIDDQRRIVRFAWRDGGIGPMEEWCAFDGRIAPDGMVFSDGFLYVTGSSLDHIAIVDHSGRIVEIVHTGPGSDPTNCCVHEGRLWVTLGLPGQLVSCEL